ncbi:MAG: hypothetical protein HND43_11130 [Armatimonadetes bacterium]|nr:hypothetical protein [Armatimonadota bacterium]NOG39923.1 hypothetical protein [Armatimonadota bacterium]
MGLHLLLSILLFAAASLILTGLLWLDARRLAWFSQLMMTLSCGPILLVSLMLLIGWQPDASALNPEDVLEIAMPAYAVQFVTLGGVALFGLDSRGSRSRDRKADRVLLTIAALPGVVLATLFVVRFPFGGMY